MQAWCLMYRTGSFFAPVIFIKTANKGTVRGGAFWGLISRERQSTRGLLVLIAKSIAMRIWLVGAGAGIFRFRDGGLEFLGVSNDVQPKTGMHVAPLEMMSKAGIRAELAR